MADISDYLGESMDRTRVVLSDLKDRGYIVEGRRIQKTPSDPSVSRPSEVSVLSLTEEGRRRLKVILTGGVFDILHVGHLTSFEEARNLGDLLVVVVARDSTVERLKQRRPINPESERKRLVNALKIVDLAVLGDENDFLKTIEWIKPEIIAIGYDQKHDLPQLRSELDLRGLEAEVVRLSSHVPGIKSSKILSKIQEANSLD